MQIPSASVLGSWPESNYINPETRGPAEIITVSVLLALVTILLGLRVYTRLWISKGFGLDDVLILLAYIPTTAFAVISFVAQIYFDWGRHVWDLPFVLITPSLQLSLSSQLMFDLSTNLTKLSMLALIYRIVSVKNSRYRYVVLVLAVLVALDGILFFFITTFQCSPPEAYWTLSATPQACINEVQHLLAAGCINTVTDFLIMLAPIPYVRRLELPRRQQIIVASLFAGGIFVTAAGATRTAITFVTFSDPNRDLTWNSIPVFIASALELYIGIICASIPPIKPFFAHYLPQLIGNPIYWLSRSSQARNTAGAMPTKSSEKGSRLATYRDTLNTYRDVESPQWAMEVRGRPPMPGMPAPARTSRTSPAVQSRSMGDTYESLYLSRSGTPSTITTTSTAILYHAASHQRPDLNKPLPRIKSSSAQEWDSALDVGSREAQPSNITSIYQFVPHEDGHISVYKARSDPVG